MKIIVILGAVMSMALVPGGCANQDPSAVASNTQAHALIYSIPWDLSTGALHLVTSGSVTNPRYFGYRPVTRMGICVRARCS